MDTNSTIEILSQANQQQSIKPVELSDQQLDTVAGGAITVDAASPTLFQLCCTGKHIKSGKLH